MLVEVVYLCGHNGSRNFDMRTARAKRGSVEKFKSNSPKILCPKCMRQQAEEKLGKLSNEHLKQIVLSELNSSTIISYCDEFTNARTT